jgi:hypothetical protein
MKYKGRGGVVTRDTVAIANVVSFTYSETEGGAYGQIRSNTSMMILLEHDTVPLRIDDFADYVLTTGADATWDITLTNAVVTASEISVEGAAGVAQSITVSCYNSTIA